MTNLRNCKGYTLIELIIVIVIALIVVVNVVVIPTNNAWWTSDGVLKELRVDHPTITEVIKTKRNLFSYSEITVHEGGQVITYFLDSNVLFNYTFHK
ncbi:MAG: hypothetical protein UT41_C0001G0464 [Candidatus Wolfebacteria bacterium GW2011_GWC2_39_22]|uniref:Prepilin-type N-terminal cleavage/methylation domain-containing protein n=1 Tax=Candidatus Wolfebacteria bacterium GW2011_GWC2_39_22 TaxID=1619013 RepID=A0A0G0QRA4_9BACT|nr:MAG: hypothetical protein UT41_C0001G0464 [Candidatus Wolfebacteria bacterium GW2011_GWC2_39_22]HBI25424.1 hypothetical protein [Candidatus Wolfebacteria bacterium]